jgi:predicted permease
MLALARALVALSSAVVPAAFRDDWTREWQSELWHYHERMARGAELSRGARVDLLRRACGALLHALWLRKEEWSLSVILQDVRYALRGLRHRPGFALIATLMLALGIGANAAVFSVVSAVLLEPLPYRDPERLVQIWETNPLRNWTNATVAPANFLDWRATSRSFEAMAHYIGSDTKAPRVEDATLAGDGDPERARGMEVSANFFDVLGSPAAYGRTFRAEEEAKGQNHVVLLSDGFWRRRFGGAPSAVGKTIDLDGVAYEIVGIMPRGFHFPGADAEYWTPRVFDEPLYRSMRRPHWFRVIARLAPGVTLDQAREEMTRIAGDLERQYPDTNTKMGVGLGPLHEWFVEDSRRALLMLMGAVGLVLLIASTNVASLLLARATTRRKELAIRVALGAGRVRLVRQLLTESLMLAAGGGAGGVLIAQAAVVWLRGSVIVGVPRLDHVVVDGRVLAFVVASAFVTALIFGLAPAWHTVRSAPGEGLQQGSRGSTAAGVVLRRVLVSGEVALSVVLLVGAGLLIRSFVQLRGVDPGIAVSGGLSFKISLPSRYDTDEKIAGFYSDAIERFRSMPGVDAAGATVKLALEGASWTGDLFVEARPDVWGRELRHKSITPGYLRAAGISLQRGRDFTNADTATSMPVAIVNEAFVRTFLGGSDPIDQRIAFRRPSAQTSWRTIVGVARDEKQDALAAPVKPEVYEPHAQNAFSVMAVIVRTPGDPRSTLAAVRREIAAIDGRLAVYDARTLQEVVDRSLSSERFATVVLIGFAACALLLAAIGLYGVIAFSVTARTREIGVRLALGASRRQVLRMVVWDGLRVVLAGLVAGLVAALAVGRVVDTFLYETAAIDPAVLMSVAGLLAATGALASYLPALRAAQVDPSISLRAD